MNLHLWQRAEWSFQSRKDYENPLQDVEFSATFVSPTKKRHKVYGFWDGAGIWRIRFAPDEIGEWSFRTICSDTANPDLVQEHNFYVEGARGKTRFQQHGPLKLANNRRYFVHADGSPFFWLADTVWNGPLLATDNDWQEYLEVRSQQKFSALQWVATQWLAAPQGDRTNTPAFNGHERIHLNLEFFRQLERKHDAMIARGFLSVPVLLWAAHWNAEVTKDNPGASLPEDQAILLARYMVARWGADPVVWFLPGDADYQAEHAERWRRIGRAVFADIRHAPVTLHPNGQQWIGNFKNEDWLDFIGYQSGHGDGDSYDKWLLEGPPAKNWQDEPMHPVINLEPPYENHLAYQSKNPFSAWATRKRLYWSLLVSPTAGVSYGGHGVWGWDDGSSPPTAHPNTGTPLPWQKALTMPAANQIAFLHDLFMSIEWWRLRPAQDLILEQTGAANSEHYLLASLTDEGDLALVYAPENHNLLLDLSGLKMPLETYWFEPQSAQTYPAEGRGELSRMSFTVPAGQDWLLVLQKR